ncbi:MAG: hypothetical protein WCJ05_02770 [bacterium]
MDNPEKFQNNENLFDQEITPEVFELDTAPIEFDESDRLALIDESRMVLDGLYSEQVEPEEPQSTFIPKAAIIPVVDNIEADRPKKLTLRKATIDDVEKLVDVDIKAFNAVYKDYDVAEDEWRSSLVEKFKGRLEKIDNDWCQVLENHGKIVGFIMACPTSKKPEEFTSWEEITDNGTLDTMFDPKGKNIYVVSLSVLPEGSLAGGQNMLIANIIGKFIKEGYEQGFFESRLPGLRNWVKRQSKKREQDFGSLSKEQLDEYANEYFNKTKLIDGKEVPLDRLLRLYASVGCEFIKLVPDAYKDGQSMNYGVMCAYKNPIPKKLAFRPITTIVGSAFRAMSHSNKLTNKVF